jgi:UDP-N-acetylglucosamine diphosphorylase / glucose-1-phosphate thymidylyltransferase / UDP-N-acetylgalactosamine diphosphorylase / glucosamine-1-phosphate N-acetyltransferase / galactosamine-1-phosphate N-acetyltransferase
MIVLRDYINPFPLNEALEMALDPWQIASQLETLLSPFFEHPAPGFIVKGEVAVHESAVIETGAVIRGRAIISAGCFVSSSSLLRGGVWLGDNVKIGPGCELKSALIAANSAAAHFNYIGDSVVGSHVNFEAGAVIANHHNDRTDKRIFVMYEGRMTDTGVTKFGALVGDHCKIGANAVLSPGTLLPPGTIVKRLSLVDQHQF